jgi:hypothetical protein
MWSQLKSVTSTQFWILLSILLLASCSTVFAQQMPDYKADKDWEQVCKQAEAQPLTAIQPSGPLSGDQLINCDETALYYGLGEKPDYAAALQCGWFQRAHPQDKVGNMFYGPGVLTMIYANGKGVPRNYDLAIRFACENSWAAEAEMAYRIGHLEHLRDARRQSKAFDLCDDITSGLSDGFCTSIQTRTADAVRARKIDEILSGLPPSVKSAFPVLQAAELAFEKARTQGEVDLSGTSRAAFQLSEEAKIRDQFLINLQRFGRADIPVASETDLTLLDQKLNETYQKIQDSPATKWEFGTIKPDGIRDTERKWISLVDAWTCFARIAYPSLSATRVRAQLIRLRLHQLQSLYDK